MHFLHTLAFVRQNLKHASFLHANFMIALQVRCIEWWNVNKAHLAIMNLQFLQCSKESALLSECILYYWNCNSWTLAVCCMQLAIKKLVVTVLVQHDSPLSLMNRFLVNISFMSWPKTWQCPLLAIFQNLWEWTADLSNSGRASHEGFFRIFAFMDDISYNRPAFLAYTSCLHEITIFRSNFYSNPYVDKHFWNSWSSKTEFWHEWSFWDSR